MAAEIDRQRRELQTLRVRYTASWFRLVLYPCHVRKSHMYKDNHSINSVISCR